MRVVAVRADQRRDVADRARNVGHVDHRHVHRDDADHRRALAAHEHATRDCRARADIRPRSRSPASRSGARRRRDTSRRSSPSRRRRSCAGRRSRARTDDHRLGRDLRRVAAAHAVEKNPGPRDAPRRRPAMLDRRAVLRVDHRRRAGSCAIARRRSAPPASSRVASLRSAEWKCVKTPSGGLAASDVAQLDRSRSTATPARLIPVSIARCHGARSRCQRAIASRVAERRREIRRESRASKSPASSGVNTTIGRVIPARRSSSPSATSRRRSPTDRAARACARRAPRRDRRRPPSPSGRSGTPALRRDRRLRFVTTRRGRCRPRRVSSSCALTRSIRRAGSIPDPRRLCKRNRHLKIRCR